MRKTLSVGCQVAVGQMKVLFCWLCLTVGLVGQSVVQAQVAQRPGGGEGTFVGEFQGSPSLNDSFAKLTVTCSGTLTCSLVAEQPGPASTSRSATRLLDRQAVSMNPQIPNANLDHTREFVSSTPEQEVRKDALPLLHELRELLGGRDRFVSCVSASKGANQPDDFALCTTSSDPAATKSLYLLVSTMNPSCTGQPFCAYLFLPLLRR